MIMSIRRLGLIFVGLLILQCAGAQEPQPAPAESGKVLTETFVSNLRGLINSDVIIKGIAGQVKADPSNSSVYALTDKFGHTIRVRSAEGNPPLGQTYLVRGMVTEREGQLELVELGRRAPASPYGVGPAETWVVSGSEGGSADVSEEAEESSAEPEASEESLYYMLLGGGGILIVAAVGIAVSMRRGNERRALEEQQRIEQQRLMQMEWPSVQPGSTIVQDSSREAAEASSSSPAPMTMVSWGTLTVAAGPLKDRILPLPHGAITLGRTEGDIVLQTDDSVSSRHATVTQAGDGTVYLEDHSTNGTYLNDRRLNNEKAPLHSGDRIMIGPHTLEIKFSRPGAAQSAPPASGGQDPAATIVVPLQAAATMTFRGLQLLVEEGPDKGAVSPVIVPQTTIGRQSGDMLLTDPHVSRRHATIFQEDGRWILRNESNFGTMVNGAKIEQQELTAGDRISLGRTVLRLERLAKDPDAKKGDE
jgi:pSer/pThr/pTyr-binding forkhead associated (FHA) protein